MGVSFLPATLGICVIILGIARGIYAPRIAVVKSMERQTDRQTGRDRERWEGKNAVGDVRCLWPDKQWTQAVDTHR